MEFPVHSYWILLVCFIPVVTAVDDPTIVCDQTYYVEVGTQAIVSCEYDHSFLAVRWYFDGAEISFLRIDGTSKSGSGIENGEFDIGDDGSMIITEVELKHEGMYTISVLHQSGTVSSKEIMVYAMVLLDKVDVTNCRRSSNELCTKIPSLQRERTLLCVAKDSRPPVEIVWKTTFENEQVISSPPDYNVDMDPSSLLYTSSSSLQYEGNLFTLEYFTCQVNGVAAKDVHNASLLLEGKGDFTQHTENIQYVLKGSSFQFLCPPNPFQFALLKVTYSSGIENLLVTSHPGDGGGQCLDDAKCHVQRDGLITIDNMSFEDEGSYECAHGDGMDSYMHVIRLKVVVPPSPHMTVIEGCNHKEHCRMSAFTFGTLTCSLFESRPAVNLSFEIAEASGNDISIITSENQVVADGIGTYSTTLRVEYQIERCGKPIEITCKTESTAHPQIKFSKAYLDTDALHCNDKQNATLIILVVLFLVVILLVVIVLVAIVVKRKEGESKNNDLQNSKKNRNQENTTPEHGKDSKENVEKQSLLPDEKITEQQSALEKTESQVVDEVGSQNIGSKEENEEKKSLLSDEKKSDQEAEEATRIEEQTSDRKEHKDIITEEDNGNVVNKEKVELSNVKSSQVESNSQKEEKVKIPDVVAKEAGEALRIEEQTSDRQEHKGISTEQDKANGVKKELVELDNVKSSQVERNTQKEEKFKSPDLVAKDYNEMQKTPRADAMDEREVNKEEQMRPTTAAGDEIKGADNKGSSKPPTEKQNPEKHNNEDDKPVVFQKVNKPQGSREKDQSSDNDKDENQTSEDQLSTDNFTEIFQENLRNGEISMEDFVIALQNSLKIKQILLPKFIELLEGALDEKSLSTSALTDTLKESLKKGKITETAFVTSLQTLFTKEKLSMDEFTKVLKESITEKLVQAETSVPSLQSLQRSSQIPVPVFIDLLKCLVDNKLWSSKNLVDTLTKICKENLMSEKDFIVELNNLYMKNQIMFRIFIDALEQSVNQKLISVDLFAHYFRLHLNNGEWNKKEWVWLVYRLSEKQCIKNDLKLEFLNLVVEKYQMSEQGIKKILQESKIQSEERKQFISGVKFPEKKK